MTEDVRVHIVVSGKVQGVCFRVSTLEIAQSLNLRGFVKNLPDGTVEIEAEGSRISLEDLAQWCRHGPPQATVDHVAVTWSAASEQFRTFTIER